MTKKVFGIPVVGILALVAVLAALVVFLVLGMGNDVVTTVTLDVNPGIEMGLNKDNEVVTAKGVNTDGKKLMDMAELTGKPFEEAFDVLLKGLADDGYLEDDSAILVHISGENDLSGIVNGAVEKQDVKCRVIVKSGEPSAEVRELADKLGVSVGKAMLISEVVGEAEGLEAEDLKDLSIGEIVKAAEPKVEESTTAEEESTTAEAETTTKAAVTTTKKASNGAGEKLSGTKLWGTHAVEKVYAKAGIPLSQAVRDSAVEAKDSRCTNGECFKVRVEHNGYYYDAIVDAYTGAIYDYTVTAIPQPIAESAATEIVKNDMVAKGYTTAPEELAFGANYGVDAKTNKYAWLVTAVRGDNVYYKYGIEAATGAIMWIDGPFNLYG